MPIGIRRIHSWRGVRLPVRTVLLKTLQPAYLSVFYTGGGPCPHTVSAYGMLVTPPGVRAAFTVYDRVSLCAPAHPMVGPVRSRLSLLRGR